MKTLATAATLIALAATGAHAQEADNATVTLNATVAPYLAIVDSQDSTIGDLDITAGASVGANNNANNNAGGDEKATFTVVANVAYDVELAWATWQSSNLTLPDGVPTSYQQANYYNAHEDAQCSIGGTVHFDLDPDTDGSDVSYPPSGASPWTVGTAFDPTIGKTYGIGTQAEANLTNCPGGVAAPGTYSLDVDITLSAS